MTWVKFGSEFFPECMHLGLSDAAVRTHGEAIAYLYEVEEMTCRVPKRLVRTFTGSDRFADAIKELVEHGWWVDGVEFWQIEHHSDVIRQSIAAQQKKRVVSKQTSARHRARKAAEQDDSEGGDSTAGTTGVTRHVTPHADRQTDKHLEEGGSNARTVCTHWVDVKDHCEACERKTA